MQTLWKTVEHFLKWLNMEKSFDSAILFSDIYARKNKTVWQHSCFKYRKINVVTKVGGEKIKYLNA